MSIFLWKMERDRQFNAWARETFGGKATPENISLIERNHKCAKCSGAVSYVKKPDGGDQDYHFVCKECGHIDEHAPLKTDKKDSDHG